MKWGPTKRITFFDDFWTHPMSPLIAVNHVNVFVDVVYGYHFDIHVVNMVEWYTTVTTCCFMWHDAPVNRGQTSHAAAARYDL